MLGLKSTLLVGAAGLAATGYLYIKLLSAQNEILIIEKELTFVQQLADSREQAIAEQDKTIELFQRYQENDQKQIDTLTEERNKSNEQTQLALQQISQLRATEKTKALTDPYFTGNLATDRLNDSLQRIAGKTDKNSSSQDDTGTAASNKN